MALVTTIFFCLQMAMFTVFSHALSQSYKTSICSKATIFYAIASLFSIIIPLIFAFKSDGFWKKYDLYREQPQVHFKHQMLLLLETNNGEQPIVWSTFNQLNSNLKANFRIPQISHTEDDLDDNGINDEIQMEILVPVLPDENVYSVKVLLLFEYKFQDLLDLAMEGLAFIQHSSPIPGSEFTLSGELRFNQKVPVQHRGFDFRYNDSVIDTKNFNLERILQSYSSRALTTQIKNILPLWRSGRSKEQKFKIKLNISYPEETILCYLGFWQLLKWAWVQYLSILLVAFYITDKVKIFVFQHQIFPTIVKSPIKEHQI